MFKHLKQLTSLFAMIAVLFAFTTEAMAKKSKTLKTLKRRVLLDVVFLKVFLDFQMLMYLEIGQVSTLMYVEQ